jgi:NADH dehydrogenase (ubiquinone) Fe-S protein 1
MLVRALSEVIGVTLPYDDVLSLRDRMWDIAPSLVRYDLTESISPDAVVAGLNALATVSTVKGVGVPFIKPVSNFYQTDPISRA